MKVTLARDVVYNMENGQNAQVRFLNLQYYNATIKHSTGAYIQYFPHSIIYIETENGFTDLRIFLFQMFFVFLLGFSYIQ